MKQNVVDVLIRIQKTGSAQTAIDELRQLSHVSAMVVPAAAGVLAIGAGIAAVTVAAHGLSTVVDSVKSVGSAAFEAVRSYEMLGFSITQLTATQLLQAGAASDMASALTAAKGPAADLLGWMQKLAIESPYTMDQVAKSFQVAEAFGFGAQEAKRLTQDLIDLASASGKDQETLGRITVSLGQVFTQGKVTEREMRELAMAGLPIKQILADSLGVTTAKLEAMITDGAVPAIQAIRGLEQFIEQNFAGAAKRAMNTWQGLITSLQDIKQMDLRVLFTGMFDAIKPEAISVVNWLQSAEFKDQLTVVGAQLATSMRAAIATVKGEFSALDKVGAFDNLKSLAGTLAGGDQGIPGAMRTVSVALGIAAVDVNLFGQAFVTAMDTALQANQIFFTAALAGFNTLAAVWGQFVRAINSGAAAIGAVASGDWLSVTGHVQDAQQALANIGTSASTSAAIFGGATAQMAAAAQGLIDKLGALKTAHGEQVQAVLAASQAFQFELDWANGKRASYLPGQAPGPATSPWDFKGWNLTSLMPDTTKWGTTTGNAMGDSAAKRIAAAFNSLADKISNAITDASQKAKKLWDATSPTAPGTNIWEPGGNGPFERLYRVVDVAANGAAQRPDQPGFYRTDKETGKRSWVPPVETQKWMGQEGLSQPQALQVARSFQMNNLLAPGVFERVDWKQLADLSLQEQEGSKQGKYAGLAAAALLSAGKEVTPDAMRTMIEEMAKSDKDAVVPNLQDIRAAVDSLKSTTDEDLKLVLGALDRVAKGLPGGAPTAAGTGSTGAVAAGAAVATAATPGAGAGTGPGRYYGYQMLPQKAPPEAPVLNVGTSVTKAAAMSAATPSVVEQSILASAAGTSSAKAAAMSAGSPEILGQRLAISAAGMAGAKAAAMSAASPEAIAGAARAAVPLALGPVGVQRFPTIAALAPNAPGAAPESGPAITAGGPGTAPVKPGAAEVVPEAMRTVATEIAKNNREDVVPRVQEVRTAVDAMKTTTDADLLLLLGALGRIESKLPGPAPVPPTTPPTGTATQTAAKPPTVMALAAGGIAPGGTTLVGEEGPELVDLPAGSRVYPHTALETQQALAGRGMLPAALGQGPALLMTLARMAHVPGFAGGGTTPGGKVLTGEEGPELVYLPQSQRYRKNAPEKAGAGMDGLLGKVLSGLDGEGGAVDDAAARLVSALTRRATSNVQRQMLKALNAA